MEAEERRRQRRAEHPAFREQGRGYVPDGAPGANPRGHAKALVMDLSAGGCAVLMHRQQGALPDKLVVRFEAEPLRLSATPRWEDEGYSATHKQVGLHFTLLRAEDVEALEALLGRFEQGQDLRSCRIVSEA